MAKRKRDVSFIKPDEPAFIARMKAQVGYIEGPTVDTKRETLSLHDDDIERDDEQPQVVVMNDGDLTAEEAEKIQRLQDEGPADLQKRVVFRKPVKGPDGDPDPQKSRDRNEPEKNLSKVSLTEDREIIPEKKKSQGPAPKKSLLSFDEDEENQD